MQLYDLLYIISNQFTDSEVSSIKEQVENIIQKNNGKICKTIEIGRRKLSYPIKQNRYGIYFRIFFNLEPINSKKLNKDLKLNLNIIRYQIIKTKSFSDRESSGAIDFYAQPLYKDFLCALVQLFSVHHTGEVRFCKRYHNNKAPDS